MSHGGRPGQAIKRDSTVISGQGGVCGAEKPFDAMNNIVANLLLNITRCSITVCVFIWNSMIIHTAHDMLKLSL